MVGSTYVDTPLFTKIGANQPHRCYPCANCCLKSYQLVCKYAINLHGGQYLSSYHKKPFCVRQNGFLSIHSGEFTAPPSTALVSGCHQLAVTQQNKYLLAILSNQAQEYIPFVLRLGR